ncbi:hypothetical protein Cylst_1644 [Cylindrospermum stagnale PCC 7417]|uniref:Uncharacterized protein n=1 Tax=Cylindrospermum stagnale PCC 7417 TaxID=56107 RepID=K9WVU7_9NOST|nr:hypothetical protein Cylst_1644 [Cylindrospermum stagnale PCC 7417]
MLVVIRLSIFSLDLGLAVIQILAKKVTNITVNSKNILTTEIKNLS